MRRIASPSLKENNSNIFLPKSLSITNKIILVITTEI